MKRYFILALLFSLTNLSAEMVYRHVVLFQYKKSATPAQVEEATAAFKNLKKEIPQIQAFEWGKECSPEGLSQDISHCYLLTFKNKEDFNIYLKHTKHQAFVKKFLPIIEKPIVVDYETED